MPTPHHRRVQEFMQRAGQTTPDRVTTPDEHTRILRARLILEEALETIEALGIGVNVKGQALTFQSCGFEADGAVDLEGVVDGCADISVVTIGTLVAFGVDDEPVLAEVDAANLRKFGPGGYTRSDGKWVKPPDWEPPDIQGILERQ